MRFVWVQDLPFTLVPQSGGAQLTDFEMYKEGIRKGYEQALITPQNYQQIPVQEEDVLILSNIKSFGPERFLDKPNPVIMFHHDYLFCRYRLFYPRLEKCIKACAYKEPWKKLFKKAKLNIFLSPLHYKMHKEVFGDSIEPHALVPSPVDPDKFYDMKKKREKNSVLGVNCLLPFKGAKNVVRYAEEHPDLKFTFVGAKDDSIQLPKNCEFIGPVPQEKIIELLSTTEAFIHIPETPQPCERTVVEAKLSGVPKLILNPLVGATSYKQFRYDRDRFAKWISQSPKNFWKKNEKVIK